MHYYQHHIGDYKAATAHLSNEEDLAYRRLLEMYYDSEGAISVELDSISRKLRVSRESIQVVLTDFFCLTDAGWVQSRCEKEISAYQAMKRGGANGANKRWGKGGYAHPIPTLSPPQTPPNANHEPLTMNHEPDIQKVQPPEGVSISVWADFVKYRKALKAPITDTAIAGFSREAKKAGISLEQALVTTIESNWRGFKAEWLKDKPAGSVLAGAI